jgi:hypothetical protein
MCKPINYCKPNAILLVLKVNTEKFAAANFKLRHSTAKIVSLHKKVPQRIQA